MVKIKKRFGILLTLVYLMTMVFTLPAAAAAVSSDANLKSLSVTGGTVTPKFSKDVTSYKINVNNSITQIKFKPSANNSKASIAVTVDGAPVENLKGYYNVNIKDKTGMFEVVIKVTAEDKTTTKAYAITINRADLYDTDLVSLSLANDSAGKKPISVEFDKNTQEYTVIAEKPVKGTPRVYISAYAEDTTSKVVLTYKDSKGVEKSTSSVGKLINKYADLYKPVNQVKVTVNNGTKTAPVSKTYTINVLCGVSNNANLKTLKVAGQALDVTKTEQTVNVTNTVTSVNVEAETADANATVTGTGKVDNLAVGNNKIEVVVKAQDGMTTKTYTVNVVRAASSNVDLKSVKVNDQVVDLATLTINVENKVVMAAVKVETADPTATAKVEGGNNLTVGENKVTITVTAQDGTSKAYTLKIIRAASSNANLLSIKVNGQDVDLTTLTANVANEVTKAEVAAVAEDATATIKVEGGDKLVVGENTITITVTAQDAKTVKTYTLKVVRAASSNANLKSIKVNGQDVDLTALAVSVAYDVTKAEVTAVTEDATATVKVEGGDKLVVGENTVTITVTAQDAKTVKTYTLKVTRVNYRVDEATATVSFNDALPGIKLIKVNTSINGAAKYCVDGSAIVDLGKEVSINTNDKSVTVYIYKADGVTLLATGQLDISQKGDKKVELHVSINPTAAATAVVSYNDSLPSFKLITINTNFAKAAKYKVDGSAIVDLGQSVSINTSAEEVNVLIYAADGTTLLATGTIKVNQKGNQPFDLEVFVAPTASAIASVSYNDSLPAIKLITVNTGLTNAAKYKVDGSAIADLGQSVSINTSAAEVKVYIYAADGITLIATGTIKVNQKGNQTVSLEVLPAPKAIATVNVNYNDSLPSFKLITVNTGLANAAKYKVDGSGMVDLGKSVSINNGNSEVKVYIYAADGTTLLATGTIKINQKGDQTIELTLN